MKRAFLPWVILAALLALAACAAKEEAPPPPAAPAAPAAKPAWEEEWERVLAAAKREGKVVVAGPTGVDERNALTKAFERKYGITVEYLAVAGPEFAPRVRTEREAGQYLWDVHIGGPTNYWPLVEMGALDPIEPALILPEVKDLKNWQDGKLLFMDKEQRLVLAFFLYTRPSLFANTNLVNPREFTSYRDLLDPKWKGKILVGRDPRVGGPGQADFRFFYAHPNLGPDFIRALAKQDLTILRDDRQAAEWLAQGRYPILIGVADRFVINLKQQGLPVVAVEPRQMKEGGSIAPASGIVGLLNRGPHPNAAKLYINWLLTREGQTEASRASSRLSRRVDVPTNHLDPAMASLLPGSTDTSSQQANEDTNKVLPLLREVFGP